MGKILCQIIFLCFLFEFLSRTSIRTFEAENIQKNKHIQPQPKFRCSYKIKRVISKFQVQSKAECLKIDKIKLFYVRKIL